MICPSQSVGAPAGTPRRIVALSLCLGLLVPAADAAAVVPAASRVLDATRAAAPPAAAFVLNLVEVPAEGSPKRAQRVAYDGAGRLRVDAQDLATGDTRTTWYGPATTEAVLPLDAAPLWALYLAGQPLDALLRARGVDLDRTSLAHADGVVLWVLGAGPRDADTPQLAVERSTGAARRLVDRVGPAENLVTVDVSFEGRQAADGPAARFPDRLRVRVGDAPPEVWRISWLSVDAAPDAREMEPPARAPDPGAP